MEKIFPSKVAGVFDKNDDGTSRQEIISRFCKPGTPLFFKRDPDNWYDPNAVAIWVETDDGYAQIGYLTAYVAEEVAPFIDDKDPFKNPAVFCQVEELTGYETIGVNIWVYLGDFDLNDELKIPFPDQSRKSSACTVFLFLIIALIISILIYM